MCIESVTTTYQADIVNRFKNKQWGGHRVILSPEAMPLAQGSLSADREIAFETRGFINKEELKLVATKSGQPVIYFNQRQVVQYQVEEDGKRVVLTPSTGLGPCGDSVPNRYGDERRVSNDFLCYSIVIEYTCRKGLF